MIMSYFLVSTTST